MNAKLNLVLVFVSLAGLQSASAQSTAFTYQGRLTDNGAPANGTYDVLFRPFGVYTGGSQLTIPNTRFVQVSNGLFTTTLDFGSPIFDGNAVFLQLEVRTNGGPSYVTLAPRQQLTSAPYSIFAATVNNGAVDTPQLANGAVTALKLASNSVTSAKIADFAVDTMQLANSAITTAKLTNGAVTTPKLGDDAVTSAKVLNGTLIPADLDVERFNTTFWRTGGNSNTTPGTHFIGTTDDTPFEIHVNGERVLRVTPGTNGAPNIIAGSSVNRVINNAHGATIGGGGRSESALFSPPATNQVSADYGTVGGGRGNHVSGGSGTVSGGEDNVASGSGAVVPGGSGNIASGYWSFAAGIGAKADDDGSFVWADLDFNQDFHSTAANGFFVRCRGGAKFVTAIDTSGNATAGVRLGPGDNAWSSISDRNAKKNFQPVDAVAVLNKLSAIPVTQWNYKWESDTKTPHLGPMAQEFKAAFYPGRDDKSISTLEFDGVELAAIQGLNEKLKRKEAEISELRSRLEALEKIIRNQNQIERTSP